MKKPKAEKPKTIEIITGRLTRRAVSASWEQGEGFFDLTERDNPLPSLRRAMETAAEVAADVVHFPAALAKGLRVDAFEFGRLGGADTIRFHCVRSFDDLSKEWTFWTPPKLLAHPTQEGTYHPPLKKDQAEACLELRAEFKKYVLGDRAQGQLALEEDEGEEQSGDLDLKD